MQQRGKVYQAKIVPDDKVVDVEADEQQDALLQGQVIQEVRTRRNVEWDKIDNSDSRH